MIRYISILNKAWGIIYSVSGLTGLVLDRFLTTLVSNDVNHWKFINIGLYIFSTISSILFCFFLLTDINDDCTVKGYHDKDTITPEDPLIH